MKSSPCSAPISQFSWSDSALPRLLYSAPLPEIRQATVATLIFWFVWKPARLRGGRYFGAQFYLEDLLGRRGGHGEPTRELRAADSDPMWSMRP